MITRDVAEMKVHRQPQQLTADPRRVITRLFLPGAESRIKRIIDRVLALSANEVDALWAEVISLFASRHKDINAVCAGHFKAVASYLEPNAELAESRRLLIGAYFTCEYSLESVALFNPSIVPHPDQSGVEPQSLRFVMSLRACGEGHVSSIAFRTGTIGPAGQVALDPVTPFTLTVPPVADRRYEKHPFFLKLIEMGVYNAIAGMLLAGLADRFALRELQDIIDAHRLTQGEVEHFDATADSMLWLARSNYHLRFPADSDMSERVIFPVTENESRGIEDARFVRFTHDDGRRAYYATYTAYNGVRALPQFIETEDFCQFKIITLNGRYAQDKGLSLFPRMVNDQYLMIGRPDGERLHLLESDNMHFWNECTVLDVPAQSWEFVQLGTCGSPIETPAGWLVLTHGVGPMRRYAIGAILLDLDDPSKVIGHTQEPIMTPLERERDGYVPNVLYSCGPLVHNDILVIPYGISDTSTGIATLSLPDLLSSMAT